MQVAHFAETEFTGNKFADTQFAGTDQPLFAQWLGTVHPASEQMYFLGMPVAHVVAYEDHHREARRARIIALAARSMRPRILA